MEDVIPRVGDGEVGRGDCNDRNVGYRRRAGSVSVNADSFDAQSALEVDGKAHVNPQLKRAMSAEFHKGRKKSQSQKMDTESSPLW